MEPRTTSAASLRGTLWTGRERDACGMGFVAAVDGTPSRRIVELALDALDRLAHRGAVDAGDGDGRTTGDGAGVLVRIPWTIVAGDIPAASDLVALDRAALAMCFLPAADESREHAREMFHDAAAELDVEVVGWRRVPVDRDVLGDAARATLPMIEQAVLGLPESVAAGAGTREALLYRLRRIARRRWVAAGIQSYIASCSMRTVTYKGLVVGRQLRACFPDLADPRLDSHVAVFHQRYSTNTFPTWERAQPLRSIAHNGEINTVHGNATWLRARGAHLGWTPDRAGPGDDGTWIQPVVDPDGSDSAMLDDAVQLLTHAGRDLAETMTMLIPPAWDHEQDVREDVRDLLRTYAATAEPWDGPAAVAFTDGRVAGACLDRNGLRPARWLRTGDGIVACASEAGAVPVDPASVVQSGRLGPGEMLLVDTVAGTVASGEQPLLELATSAPWGVLVAAQQVDVPHSSEPADVDPDTPVDPDRLPLVARQSLFGYSREELTAIVRPMATTGSYPVGSMGDDTPVAPLATVPRSLYGFVRQGFAEVTNPAIDPLRERSSMSLQSLVGARPRLLEQRGVGRIALRVMSPVLTPSGLDQLRELAASHDLVVRELSLLVPADRLDADGVRDALGRMCEAATSAVRDGADVLVLDDHPRQLDGAPLPMLLAASAVHQHLVDHELRTRAGLVCDTGEVRDAHALAALVGHGVDAVCPRLVLETATDLASGPRPKVDCGPLQAQRNVVAALEAGLLTAMSRMGISTLDGYRGAQVFEAVGLDPELAHHLRGTINRPGSTGLAWVAERLREQHAAAAALEDARLASPGFFKFKRDGEQHGFSPAVVAALQHAVGVDDVLGEGLAEARSRWNEYLAVVRDRPPIDLRDLLAIEPQGGPIPLDQVEPASELVRRFSTGAMSHGSLASEAHETLALGAHLVGAWSNSGEGGEDRSRFGTERSSDIKQVASGRFGVTPAYLRSARELQIKIAQGSKPGEGGHLPGHKVTEEIARIRHTQPGVSLISPPPHHDIYSIEDLAQLVHDLASICPTAACSVKLVSQAGVGTIAAGVAKARADVVVISGASGGTGASPLASIKHAGMPWEWGLAETQQVLVANRLRGRIRVRVDGGLRTGHDVLVAALLGADEFSFGTAALVAEGCTMARTCHNDKCPVGIATQRAELRELFPGRPDHVGAFLLLVAEELRGLLAALGARRLDDVIGRTDLLRPRHPDPAVRLDELLASADVPRDWPRRHVGERNEVPSLEDGLDARLARELWPSLLAGDDASTSHHRLGIDSLDRSVGARISGDIAERLDPTGLDGTRAHVRFDGAAGQSFAAFAIRGLRLELVGEANDGVGKGLAGAQVDLRFPAGSPMADDPARHVIAGNACLYGATNGLLLVGGCAGERFAVRNSGASAVVEGAGDHLCEYMTGGTVVVLGPVGRNVASGMTGGTLWVVDDGRLEARLAPTAHVVEPGEEGLAQLRELLELHAERTGSARARELLRPGALEESSLRCVTAVEQAAPVAVTSVPA